MKKTQAQELKELRQKEIEVEMALERLSQSPDYPIYQAQILALAETIKSRCIRATDIDEVKGLQAQYALLLSIWKLGEIPEPRGEEGE